MSSIREWHVVCKCSGIYVSEICNFSFTHKILGFKIIVCECSVINIIHITYFGISYFKIRSAELSLMLVHITHSMSGFMYLYIRMLVFCVSATCSAPRGTYCILCTSLQTAKFAPRGSALCVRNDPRLSFPPLCPPQSSSSTSVTGFTDLHWISLILLICSGLCWSALDFVHLHWISPVWCTQRYTGCTGRLWSALVDITLNQHNSVTGGLGSNLNVGWPISQARHWFALVD